MKNFRHISEDGIYITCFRSRSLRAQYLEQLIALSIGPSFVVCFPVTKSNEQHTHEGLDELASIWSSWLSKVIEVKLFALWKLHLIESRQANLKITLKKNSLNEVSLLESQSPAYLQNALGPSARAFKNFVDALVKLQLEKPFGFPDQRASLISFQALFGLDSEIFPRFEVDDFSCAVSVAGGRLALQNKNSQYLAEIGDINLSGTYAEIGNEFGIILEETQELRMTFLKNYTPSRIWKEAEAHFRNREFARAAAKYTEFSLCNLTPDTITSDAGIAIERLFECIKASSPSTRIKISDYLARLLRSNPNPTYAQKHYSSVILNRLLGTPILIPEMVSPKIESPLSQRKMAAPPQPDDWKKYPFFHARFSDGANKMMSTAKAWARSYGAPSVDSCCVMLALLADIEGNTSSVFKSWDITLELVLPFAKKYILSSTGPYDHDTPLSPLLDKAIENAVKAAEKHNLSKIESEDVMYFLLSEKSVVIDTLKKFGLKQSDIKKLRDSLIAWG